MTKVCTRMAIVLLMLTAGASAQDAAVRISAAGLLQTESKKHRNGQLWQRGVSSEDTPPPRPQQALPDSAEEKRLDANLETSLASAADAQAAASDALNLGLSPPAASPPMGPAASPPNPLQEVGWDHTYWKTAAGLGYGVQGLESLASNNEKKSGDEMDKAKNMGGKKDAAFQAASNAQKKAIAAGEAIVDYADSASTHRKAQSLAMEAAAARSLADQKKKGVDAMEQKYAQMASAEAARQEELVAARKEEKKNSVLAQTKQKESKELKEAMLQAQYRFQEAQVEMKAAEDLVQKQKRVKAAVKEASEKASRVAVEANTTWSLAVNAASEATKEALSALRQKTIAADRLGQEEAKDAGMQQRCALMAKELTNMRTFTDGRIADAHIKIEQATLQEAKASAAVTEANTLVENAKNKAGFVGYLKNAAEKTVRTASGYLEDGFATPGADDVIGGPSPAV